MRYRSIGKTGISISEIGLGCWALGGPNWEKGTIASGWSSIQKTEVHDAVSYALDNGVNHFDNADCYGNGKAERLLGEALGERTKDVFVSSKVGWFPGCAEHAYESTHIRHQCEQSLRNLKRDTIDIYYFHHCNFGRDDEYLPEAMETFIRLKDEGKIRAIGVSSYTQKDLKRVIPVIKPDVVQVWANLMDYHFIAKNSPLQQLCEQFDVSIIPFQALNQGLLLDKYDWKNPPTFGLGDHRASLAKFSPESIKDIHERLSGVKECFGSTAEDLAAVAFQFVLQHERVAGILAGFRNVEQVKSNLAKSDFTLNGSDMKFLYNQFR